MAIYGEAYNFKALHETSHMGQATETQPSVMIAKPGNKTAAPRSTQNQQPSQWLLCGRQPLLIELNHYLI